MDERGPLISDRTAHGALDTRARGGGSGCGPFISRWTAPREPRRAGAEARVRQQSGTDSELAGRVAGEGGYGGAGKGLKWNPNTIANPRTPVVRSEVT